MVVCLFTIYYSINVHINLTYLTFCPTLIDKLSEHFTPAPSEIVERFQFHTRFRKPGESVTAFVSELCSIAKSCNFGDTLETMLRDRIVCGINDSIIQHRLLAEKGLSFKTALILQY